MSLRCSLLLFVSLVVLPWSPAAAQSATPADLASVELPPELDRVLRDYEAAWAAGSPAELAALFADDGFVLTGGQPPVRGREAIEHHYVGAKGSLSLRALAYAQAGDVAWVIGAYSNRADAPDLGKFTLTLRQDAEGRWLIAGDMDNPNQRRR